MRLIARKARSFGVNKKQLIVLNCIADKPQFYDKIK